MNTLLVMKQRFIEAVHRNLLEDYNEQANEELLKAVETGDLRKVVKALDNGADPNFTSSNDGRSVLYKAVKKDYIKIIEALLSSGAKVNSELLMKARFEALELLLKYDSDDCINKGYGGFISPIVLYTNLLWYDEIKTLVNHGAYLYFVDSEERNLLKIANDSFKEQMANIKDKDKEEVKRVCKNYIKIVNLINKVGDKDEQMEAKGLKNFAEKILKTGELIDLNDREFSNEEKKHFALNKKFLDAIIKNDYDTVEDCLEQGVNPSTLDVYGICPLDLANKYCGDAMKTLLQDYGAEYVNTNMLTPFSISFDSQLAKDFYSSKRDLLVRENKK